MTQPFQHPSANSAKGDAHEVPPQAQTGLDRGLDHRLDRWFQDCPGALIAFSAGVDSSVVAIEALARLGADRTLAVMSASESLKISELEAGKAFAAQHGLPLKIIRTREIENPDYAANPVNRCYHCKTALYSELASIRQDPSIAEHAAKVGANLASWWLLNGQNADDAGDYRPGIQAADEHAVRRPLADLNIDKAGVRALAAARGLECADKPASPCLSSRIPYGQPVTLDKLRRIEAAEALLVEHGFPIVRVRHRAMTAAIEVPADRVGELQGLRSKLDPAILSLGFEQIEVDDEGFVSGKLNRAIPIPVNLTIRTP